MNGRSVGSIVHVIKLYASDVPGGIFNRIIFAALTVSIYFTIYLF